MFKSIRSRISALFVLLVVITELVVGLVRIGSFNRSIKNEYEKTIANVFTEEMIATLTEAANAVSVSDGEEGEEIIMSRYGPEAIGNISDIVMQHSDELGIGAEVSYRLLDSNGDVLFSSTSRELEDTADIIAGAADGESVTVRNNGSIFYALPLMGDDGVAYIVYISNTLDMLHRLTSHMWVSLLILILISAVAAYFISFIIVRSVTMPVSQLVTLAQRLADGEKVSAAEYNRRDEIGKLANALIHLSDTSREYAQRSDAEREKLEAILENMTDGILAFDMRGKLTHINPEAKRLINRSYIDDITFNKFFKEINANITLEDLHFTVNNDSTERQITINGHLLQLSFVIFSRDSSEGGVIVIIHDVTKHERLEGARRDFVADVSHELRTPLTVIKSYADILADTPDAEPELRTRFLNTISSETDRMTNIISDLLTLSKLDVDANYTRPTQDIDIRSMLDGLVERLSLTAKKKDQKLIYTPMNDVPTIRGDRDGLERVFTNIISNALKYTPSGGEINIFSSKVYNDIIVKVSDNGIGIPKNQLPNIFDRFYRVDKARSRDKGGTGLGLAIAKQTIESSFGGKIVISSELNKGTDVSINIPIQNTKRTS